MSAIEVVDTEVVGVEDHLAGSLPCAAEGEAGTRLSDDRELDAGLAEVARRDGSGLRLGYFGVEAKSGYTCECASNKGPAVHR